MTTHVINLDRYCASAEGVRGRLVLGTWGSYGIEALQLLLGDGWAGRTVTVVFHGPKTSAGTTVLAGDDGLVPVPQEATANAGYGTLTIVGVDAGSQRISVDVPYVVQSHAPVDGAQPDPTPDQWQQFVAQVKADADRAEAAAAKLPDPAPADTGKSVVVQSDGNYGLALVQGGGGGGTGYNIGHGLKVVDGTTLEVDTAEKVEQDNTLPVTSAAVYVEVGNIDALLQTI